MFTWHIDFGNILTLAGFLFALWKFHIANFKKTADIERTNIERAGQMHADNIKVLTAINTKLDIMWAWFTKNQIGKFTNED